MLKHSIIFSTLLGFTFATIFSSPVVAKNGCANSKQTGSARAPTKSAAKIAARVKWRTEVVRHGHPNRAIWKFSSDKSTSCKSKVYGYKCWAKAIPCSALPTTDQVKDLGKVVGKKIKKLYPNGKVVFINDHDHRGEKGVKETKTPPPLRVKPEGHKPTVTVKRR